MASYHIFSLSAPLVDTLIPRNLATQTPEEKQPQESEDTVSPSTIGPRACNICQGVSFLDVNEQRNHFRSDWHRYNVKLKLNSQNTVSVVEFNQLVDGALHFYSLRHGVKVEQPWKIRYQDRPPHLQTKMTKTRTW
jgi:hypothetical protein